MKWNVSNRNPENSLWSPSWAPFCGSLSSLTWWCGGPIRSAILTWNPSTDLSLCVLLVSLERIVVFDKIWGLTLNLYNLLHLKMNPQLYSTSPVLKRRRKLKVSFTRKHLVGGGDHRHLGGNHGSDYFGRRNVHPWPHYQCDRGS